ncbi:hypothetical protein K488DRAFT_85318 [Vararia minispora EC-137]|uniref:Uncharacterized protein n=1 Tax=Vararia minispora EC-137 TaxID=1314806 RepID=A0ACB8QNS7_9AGAM|nr:hypothetical protein K488DRAFT_85318 [Vararia minispora EC-137]
MFHLSLLTLVLALTQLLAVLCAPIGFQTSLRGKVSPECNANQLLLQNDLASAQQSMDIVSQAVDTPEVQTVQLGITSAMQGLAQLARSSRIGLALDPDLSSYMMSNATLARTALDTITGVPDVVTAAELTAASYSLIDAIQNAGAVANTC